MKTYEQIEAEKQKRIAEAIKNKTAHQSKTEMSIGFRWAVNVAVAFLPEKLRGTKKGFKMVEKYYQEFMDLDRSYMLENMPVEPTKLIAEDFIIAKENAPKSEAEEERARELGAEEKINQGIDESTTTEIPEEIPPEPEIPPKEEDEPPLEVIQQ